jgi:integrase
MEGGANTPYKSLQDQGDGREQMPRASAGPKLWFDKNRERWTISDGKSKRRTSCRRHEIRAAEKELADYIAEKHTTDNTSKAIADILMAYIDEVVTGKISEKEILSSLKPINKWWGDKFLADVTVANCRSYALSRGSAQPSARNELAYMRAALRHWNKNHAPIVIPEITMPPRSAARQRVLTRSEAAAFLWSARKIPHIARFFIIGWYTGSRKAVILNLRWPMIDLKTRILLRKPPGAVETKKRAPPIPIGGRLLAHLRRWKRLDGKRELLIYFPGRSKDGAIQQNDRAWHKVRELAELSDDVTPHVLRHTRATEMLKQSVSVWDVAQFLGMSVELVQSTYGHCIPGWLQHAADAR